MRMTLIIVALYRTQYSRIYLPGRKVNDVVVILVVLACVVLDMMYNQMTAPQLIYRTLILPWFAALMFGIL